MGLALTQVVTEDRASGGQVIDGSLRFDSGNSTHLNRTSAAGNRRTFTASAWVKKTNFAQSGFQTLISWTNSGGTKDEVFAFHISNASDTVWIFSRTGATSYYISTSAVLRDPSAWYHLVFVVDTTQATDTNRFKIYVNGELASIATSAYPPQNHDLPYVNVNGKVGYIGAWYDNPWYYLNGYLDQVIFIDGSALDASYFGFTDPLTNTWRPKKYTGTYGTNGFYLPMDGNSLIGEDKSGNGNDFTPVNFGGSNSIEKATGALPILNTVNGGTTATVGVRTDSDSSGLGLALPLVGTVNDVSNQVNNGSTTKTITKGNNVDADTQRYNFYGGSHRFNGSTDYLDVAASSDFAFGTGDFTVECWIYSGVNSLDTYYRRIYMTDGPTGNATGNFQIAITPTSGVINLWETSGQLDVNGTTDVTDQKWNHIAAVRSGTTLKLYVNGVEELSTTYSTSVTANSGSPRPRIGNYDGGSGGGDFDGYMQDLRVYKGVAKYTSNFIPASTNPDILPETPSGVAYGSALTKITDGSVSFDGSGDYLSLASTSDFGFGTGDFTVECFVYSNDTSLSFDYIFDFRTDGNASEARMALYPTGAGGTLDLYVSGGNLISAGSFRISAWNHVAVVRNSGTTTLYLNGISIGSASDSTNYADAPLQIGQRQGYAAQSWNGFISNFRVIKGTALYTANFTPPSAPLTNVTNTKLLCCQSTTSATAAAVTPGSITANGNAAATNFNPFTTDINTVRGQESGYATFNPLQTTAVSSSDANLTNGNLDVSFTASANNYSSYLTQSIESGKYYFEVTINSSTTSSSMIGFVGDNNLEAKRNATASAVPGLQGTYGRGVDGSGTLYDGVGGNDGSYMPSWSQGDVIMVQIDADNDRFYLGKNGILQTTAITFPAGTTKPYYFGVGDSSGSVAASFSLNTGQKPFKYAPPEGFKTLCLANLPRPTKAAVRPDKYFQPILYTGNNSTQTITGGLNFSPDFIWAKNRDSAGYHFDLYDRVRGDNLRIYSSQANGEGTGYLQFSNTNDFTLTSGGGINASGDAHVAWCWKAGGAAVSNTDGNVTSTVSANQDAGFSIVSYTSSTTTKPLNVGHGLGKKPDLILTKNRIQTASWGGYHSATGATKSMFINTTGSGTVSIDYWNNTEPTDSVFTVFDSNNTHSYGTTNGFIAYCWTSIEGFSKFGSYTSNSNADGPFVYCGFRPALVWLKKTSAASNWFVYDTARNTYNALGNKLYLENSTNENGEDGGSTTSNIIDTLSNGFKLRSANGTNNGGSYLFCAWAEAPTNNLFGGQANAR